MDSGNCCARVLLLIIGLSGATSAWAVDPNPLQSAYWRFEEGPANSLVPPTTYSTVENSVYSNVRDSMNENHLEVFSINSAPLYVTDVPATPLQSGLPNTLAFDFLPNNDLYTQFGPVNESEAEGGSLINPPKLINNGIIAPGGGYTIEAAFKARDLSQFQAIIAKEGRPVDDEVAPVDFIENLPTLALKTRGDSGVLQIEQFDAAGNLVEVSSTNPLVVDQWYQTAVVNDGTQLMLFLDSNDGMGYQLQGTVAVDGALYQADERMNGPSWSNSWTIGRGQFGGDPSDFFNGFIDEVRLTNEALAPYEFLFAPATELLVGDYNDDGTVDAADFVVWRNNLGGTGLPNDPTPGIVDEIDYLNWKGAYGSAAGASLVAAAVPEPATFVLGGVMCGALLLWRRRQAR